VDCGVVAAEPESLDVLSLLHDNVTGDLLAGVQTRLAITVDAGSQSPVTVPDAARPRGIDPANLPVPPDGLEAALRAGFRIVGRGLIAQEECDAGGLLQPHNYVGRISDGMPNLWAFVNPPAERSARASGALGGAALEQRLDIRAPLSAGAVFTQLSGVRAIGGKTQQMAHVIYDETRGRVAATMEAVGVAMDLETRRAVAISDERRAHLEQLLLR
jgi:acyl-CoA thioester hydrolase